MNGPPAIFPKYRTLGEALEVAGNTAEAISFATPTAKNRDQETVVKFADIRRRAREIASSLRDRGVKPGDRVALVLPTCPAFVESFFGAILARAVPVPLYPPVRLGRMDEYHRRTTMMIETVGASIVVTDDRIRPLLGSAVDRARPPLGCVTVANLSGNGEYEEPGDANDIALIQFSSGTTVDSKPVALTHLNVLSNVAAIDRYIADDNAPNPSGVSWLPLYHDMGLIGCLFEALYRPGSITLIPPELFLARPAVWLRAISARKATISAAPNFAFGYCTLRILDEELYGVDLSSWTLALNGAEPVTNAVLQKFAGRFSRWGFRPSALTPVYGLSEASLAVTFKPGGGEYRVRGVDADILAGEGVVQSGSRDAVSVGVPLAGVSVELRDEDGAIAPTGHTGRIFVRGPSIMHGYFNKPDLTDAALKKGWLDTGDIGFEDGGELFVCGRAKEVVILRGANHAPHEFEEALDGLEGVRAGCAVAFGFLPPDGESEELAMLVEVEALARPDIVSRIAARVIEHTGIRPTVVEALTPGTLPRTSSGKLRRREASRLWQAKQLQPPKPVTAIGVSIEMAKGQYHHLRSKILPKQP